MKKNFFIVILLLLIFTLFGCGSKDENELPDFPSANGESNSWLQWQSYDDNIIDVSWYVDLANFNYNNSTLVANKIKEKTGINIIFETPSNTDGSKLSTMISGNKLPDIISIAANTPVRIQLSEEKGYIYSITDLASKWAPSLLNRLDDELISYYTSSDKKLYGIPSLFYSTTDLSESIERGYSITSNGAIVARKDMLDAYHEAMYQEDSNWNPASVANPQGILKMCLWVKEKYRLDASNPTVAISPFESHRTHGSVGLRWLMEYFSVPQEDKDGNYVYQWDTYEFEEMMLWLNSLYRNQLMTSGNMTATSAQVGKYIQNGLPFIYIGSPQDYTNNFKMWNLTNPLKEKAEYVPIIFTNSANTVPQLSITGNSYMYTMVSTNSKRPDRIIKLLDFLYSEEGQRLMTYGIEATNKDDSKGTFFYKVEPGTTVTLDNGKQYTYKYGQIEYTDKVIDDFNNQRGSSYGFFSPSVSQNGAYPYLSSVNGGIFYTYNNYITYNLKAALKPYTYIYRGFEFELDPTDENFLSIVNIESSLRLLWMEYYAEIICAKTEQLARSILKETLSTAKRRGLSQYIDYKNASFQKHKAKYNINFAWPINDPNSNYHNLIITSIYGDQSYYKEVPSSINKK